MYYRLDGMGVQTGRELWMDSVSCLPEPTSPPYIATNLRRVITSTSALAKSPSPRLSRRRGEYFRDKEAMMGLHVQDYGVIGEIGCHMQHSLQW